MNALIETRRAYTSDRFAKLKEKLEDARRLCEGKACVYATGSFARGEANQWSDLDLFIVGSGTRDKRSLPRLEEIRVKADLIEVTEEENIPPFSGDGKYLEHYAADDLVGSLGKPEDDALNTFTARLLLLLESRPLLEDTVYKIVIDQVLAEYWEEFIDHSKDFMPAFLSNDILRLWRTFCVNYEARTQKEPISEKTKRKIKNYKLKYSRLLTCYSAILFLLDTHVQKKTVTPEDGALMVSLTPTARLEKLAVDGVTAARQDMIALLDAYEQFLEVTDCPPDDLFEVFSDRAKAANHLKSAYAYGDLMFRALAAVGQDSRFYRILSV